MIVKPGVKTSEFAVVLMFVALAVLGMLGGYLSSPYAEIVAGVISTAYILARGLAKKAGVEPPPQFAEPPKGSTLPHASRR